MPVIVAREFYELIPPRVAAGETDGGHRRLRSRIDEPHALHVGRGVRDLFRKFRLPRGGRAEGQPLRRGGRHRPHHLFARMTENERTPAHHIVEIGVPRPIDDERPLSALDKDGIAPHGAERAHGGIDPAGQNALCALEVRHAFPSHAA